MLHPPLVRSFRLRTLVGASTLLCAAFSACSNEETGGSKIDGTVAGRAGVHGGGDAGSYGNGPEAAGNGNRAASGGNSAAGASSFGSGGATGLGGSIGIALGGDSGVDEGGVNGLGVDEKACRAETRASQRVPVDMYFLMDSSGSMAEDVQGGSKWDVVSSALVEFLTEPRNRDLGVGIGYFPNSVPTSCSGNSDCLCIPLINICFITSGGSCSVSDYRPDVPLVLPTDPAGVASSIRSREVGGGTPTRPALEGAVQYLNDWAEQHPGRKPVLVLATDGDPTGCDDNTPRAVADLAAAALSGPHAIQTFVIGVGASLVSLNSVAQAGGTERAFLVDTGGDVAGSFSDALEQIRGVTVSCDFTIPDDHTSEMKVNPNKVNVRYTPKGGSSALVTQAFENDPGNCGAEGGWYYDDPKAPSKIRLCESTCQALSGGSIEVEFGCDTIVQPPR